MSPKDLVSFLGNAISGPVALLDSDGQTLACNRPVDPWLKDVLVSIGRQLTSSPSGVRLFEIGNWTTAAFELRSHKETCYLVVMVRRLSGPIVSKPPQLEHHDLTMDDMFDEVLVVDANGRCLAVNSAIQRLYGITPDDAVGKHLGELEAQGCFSASVASIALKTARRVTLSQVVKQKHLVATANPIFDPGGRLTRVIVNTHDVTQLTLLKERLATTQDLVERYWAELVALRREVTRIDDMVLRSSSMQKILDLSRKVALADSTVLLTGESGTGKDMFARLIHRLSPRRSGPFITVNCSAIPDNLLESELFGYEAGAFTGAKQRGKLGLVETAEGGTLFLNEVADLPHPSQSKVLHLIQDRQFVKVGGERTVNVNVRIIAATNRNLKEMVAQGKFRQDLFYRLSVIPIHLPPLRERREDIIPLAEHFLNVFSKKYGKRKEFSPEACEALTRYDWPGNVRELENLIELLVVTTDSELIRGSDLPPEFGQAIALAGANQSRLTAALQGLERLLIKDAIDRFGSTRKAAQALGISQPTLVRKMRKLGIVKDAS